MAGDTYDQTQDEGEQKVEYEKEEKESLLYTSSRSAGGGVSRKVMDESSDREIGISAMKKVSRRVLPLIFAAGLMNNISANNIALVSSGIMDDLKMNAGMFGMCVSIFFIPHVIFQIPLSLLAKRAGARRALPIMMLVFGMVSISTCAVTSIGGLVTIRVILGAVQSPYIPFVSAYIATFYGSDGMSKAFALSVNLGNTLAQIVPFGALILRMTQGSKVMAPWRWLFLIEALPNFLLVIPLYMLLPDGPSSSGSFLSAAELRWMTDREKDLEIAREKMSARLADSDQRPALVRLLFDVRVMMLVFALFFLASAYSGVFFYLPLILSNDGKFSSATAALLNSIPFLIATPLSLVNASMADKSGKRLRHVIFGQTLAVTGMLLTALVIAIGSDHPSTALELASLTVTEIGTECFYIPFVAFQGEILPESVATTGYALINMAGATGFSIGPSVVGAMKEATGQFTLPFVALAMLALLSLSITVFLLLMSRKKIRAAKTIELTEFESDVPI